MPPDLAAQIAGPEPGTPDATHDWFKPDFVEWVCCKKCGIVRRSDRQNRPCKGIVHIGLREATP